MERACFTFELKPGTEEEYQHRHDEIWPELVEVLKDSGAANYTLFRRELQVIAYLECHPDRETVFSRIGATEVNARWSEWFEDIIEALSDDKGELFWAEEVWHLD